MADNRLKKAEEKLDEYLASQGGPLNLAEADETANDLARSVIKAVYEDNGRAFLGVFYTRSTCGKTAWEYDGHEVKNFECDFVVPEFTDELKEAIEKTREKSSAENFDKMYKTVEKIGGAWLLWK